MESESGKISWQVVWANTTNRVGTENNPLYPFGQDSDTGFYEISDDSIGITINQTLRWIMHDDDLEGGIASSPTLRNITASEIIPNICPHKSDINTGIGRARADALSLIAGGTEHIRSHDSQVDLIVDQNLNYPDENSNITFALRESQNRLIILVKYSDGTTKYAVINLS